MASRQIVRSLMTFPKKSNLKNVAKSFNKSKFYQFSPDWTQQYPVQSNIGLRNAEDFREILIEKEKVYRDTVAEDLDIFQLDKNYQFGGSRKKLYLDEDIQRFLQKRVRELEADSGHAWKSAFIHFIHQTISLNNESGEYYTMDEESIDSFIVATREHEDEINFRNLFTLVIALSLWPQNHCMIPTCHTQIEEYSAQLVQVADSLCWKRIHMYSREKDGIFLRDIWRKVVMAKAWIQVGTKSSTGSWTFPMYMIHKCANGTTHYSRRFFSKFTPTTLLDLAKVIQNLKTLPDDFHKYYAFFKFCEFIDHFDVEETAFILKVYDHHSVRTTKLHPMMLYLNENISKKLASRLNEDLLSYYGSYFDNTIHDPGMTTLHTITKKAATANYLSLHSVLKIVVMNAKSLNQNDDNVEELKQRFCRMYLQKEENACLNVQELLDLHRLIAIDEFPEGETKLLERMVDNAVQLFQNSDKSSSKLDKLLLVLHFAYRGIFDQRLYNEGLLQCSNLFVPDPCSNRVKIHKSILCGGPSKERSSVKAIDGLNKINQRDYLRLDQNDLKNLHAWTDYRPLWSDFEYSAIPGIICDIFLGLTTEDPTNYVAHTSILPFTEMNDFVFCTDSAHNLVPLPQGYLTSDNLIPCRKIPDGFQSCEWHAVSILDKDRQAIISDSIIDRRFALFKYVSDLGYHLHLFDISSYKHDEDANALVDFRRFCYENIYQRKVE